MDRKHYADGWSHHGVLNFDRFWRNCRLWNFRAPLPVLFSARASDSNWDLRSHIMGWGRKEKCKFENRILRKNPRHDHHQRICASDGRIDGPNYRHFEPKLNSRFLKNRPQREPRLTSHSQQSLSHSSQTTPPAKRSAPMPRHASPRQSKVNC